jgi:phosphate ABC transporter phosphate-binding protein
MATGAAKMTRKLGVIASTVVVGAMAVLPAAGAARAAASGLELNGDSSGAQIATILGSGSSWPAVAIQHWVAALARRGARVVFSPTGSAAGRADFAQHTVDFAVSDIGYQGYNPITGINDVSRRPYAYVPIAGGATAFPYNIRVAGHRVTSLRLSGRTIAKIFTNQITNWDDPAITRDNNGRKLPSLPITVVVPSEGSGTTAMFTAYLANQFPSLWRPFNNGFNKMTEYWPRAGSQVAQNGSTQIMNYVQQPAANGAIGITEYAYPKAERFPVARMRNAAGYYVLPTESYDAVALTRARINLNPKSPNYLLQNLNLVYNYTDPRSYPLASYSYVIMPKSKNDPRMAVTAAHFPAKWQTLASFLRYSICQGQEAIGRIGYTPLPISLVKAAFQQIEKIKRAAPKVHLAALNVGACDNPAFVPGHPDRNWLAIHAPMPPLCDKAGHGPCAG